MEGLGWLLFSMEGLVVALPYLCSPPISGEGMGVGSITQLLIMRSYVFLGLKTKNPRIYSYIFYHFIWRFRRNTLSLHCQNESFDYAAECGEQDLIDTTPFKSHLRVTFIFHISYEIRD